MSEAIALPENESDQEMERKKNEQGHGGHLLVFPNLV